MWGSTWIDCKCDGCEKGNPFHPSRWRPTLTLLADRGVHRAGGKTKQETWTESGGRRATTWQTPRSGRKSNCYHLRIEITSSLPLYFCISSFNWGFNLCHGNSSPRDGWQNIKSLHRPADLSLVKSRPGEASAMDLHGRTLGLGACVWAHDTVEDTTGSEVWKSAHASPPT